MMIYEPTAERKGYGNLVVFTDKQDQETLVEMAEKVMDVVKKNTKVYKLAQKIVDEMVF